MNILSEANGIAHRIYLSDHYLIVPKLLYFFVNSLLYAVYSFQSRYLQNVWNVDASYYGLLTSFGAFSFFFAIFWSSLAHRHSWHKEIIIFTTALYGISYNFFWILESSFAKSSETCRILISLVIFAFAGLSTSAFFPLLDFKIYHLISRDPRFRPDIFPTQRLFGTLGQGVGSYLAGKVINEEVHDYSNVFVLFILLCILFELVAIFGIPPNPSNAIEHGLDPSVSTKSTLKSANNSVPSSPSNEQESDNNGKLSAGEWLSLLRGLLSLQFTSFLVIVFLAGFGRAVVGNNFSLYLRNVLHSNASSDGLLFLLRVFPEILAFIAAKTFIRLFGVMPMIMIGQAAGAFRVLIYSFLQPSSSWLVQLIEVLRGINNSFVIASGVRLAHDLAGPETGTTAQGFFHGIHGNLATATAGLFSLAVLKYYKKNYGKEGEPLRFLFKGTSIVAFTGLVLFFIFYVATLRKLGKHPRN